MRFERLALLGFTTADLESPAGSALVRELSTRAETVAAAGDPSELEPADAVVLQLGTVLDRPSIERAPRLRFVGVFGTDQSRVDLEAAAARGITVANVPGYSTDSVAEFVFAALLERLRLLADEQRRARNGDLSAGPGGSTLGDKCIGVIGFGRIGKRVAEIARGGFGSRVLYWSRSRHPELERTLGVEFRDLGSLVSEADAVAVHLPLTRETAGILDGRVLARARRGAVWLHLSPTELLDLDALDARLGAADLDFVLDHADELAPETLARLRRHARFVPYPPEACNTSTARAVKLGSFLARIDAFLAIEPRGTPRCATSSLR